MFVELGGWWAVFKPEYVCGFFQRSRGRAVELLNSRLRLFAQDWDDAIQLIQKKKVCRPAGELDHEPVKNNFFTAEREPHDSVQRILGNLNQMSATELCSHHLAKRIQCDRLLLQIPRAPVSQIKTRARRIDADKQKLTPQSKIDRKRNRPELINLS